MASGIAQTQFWAICTPQIRWSQACELGDGLGDGGLGNSVRSGEIQGDGGRAGRRRQSWATAAWATACGLDDGLGDGGLGAAARRPDGLPDGLDGDGGRAGRRQSWATAWARPGLHGRR